MKMNLFRQVAYSLALVTALFFASCSDDTLNENDQDKPGEEGPVKKGFIAISFLDNTSSTGFRAPSAYGDLVGGTADESKINSAVIALYNTSNEKLAYRFDLNDMNAGGNDIHTISGSKYTTQAREVEMKPYKLVVFLNPPAKLLDLMKIGDRLSKLQEAVDITVDELIGPDKDNFLMGNFANVVNVISEDIKATEAEAEKTPVSLYVERAVAKIQVLLDSNFNTSNSTSGFRWQVDVVNKKTYWMRKQTQRLKDGTGSGVLIDETAGIDPAHRLYMYAESPYFSQTSADYWDHQKNILGNQPDYDRPTPADHYTYVTDADDVNLLPKSKSGSGDIAYVIENTMIAEEQWEDVSTSILVRVYYQPKGGTALGGPLGADGGTYFVYKRKYVFNQAEMAAIYADTYPGWDAIADANPTIAAFQKHIQSDEVRSIFGGANGDYTIFPEKSIQVGDLIFRLSNNLQYYRIPIRHFSDALQPKKMAYGRFGVVRNNIYKLTINRVLSLGDLDIPDTSMPDETESWLSVEYEILPWISRDQGVDL